MNNKKNNQISSRRKFISMAGAGAAAMAMTPGIAFAEANQPSPEGVQEVPNKTVIKQNKVKWEEMLPHEFVEARDRFSVCYAAYGLAEPHGAYNALGLDWLKAYGLVESSAKKYGGIIAPPFAWHIQETDFHNDGKGKGWNIDMGIKQSLCSSIPRDLFYRTVIYQIRAMDARGFHAAILVTGHTGGPEKIMRKICEYYIKSTGSPIRLYAIGDYECIDAHLRYPGEHAGISETAQLMALRPGLTDLNYRTCSEELGERFAGSVDFINGPIPTEEIGREIVESQIRNLGNEANRLLSEYRPKENWTAPDLNETEVIWNSFDHINMTRNR
jgi:creatinine amidohydrolase/Fe(II)-dependent formamide hydrolase-like protein